MENHIATLTDLQRKIGMSVRDLYSQGNPTSPKDIAVLLEVKIH